MKARCSGVEVEACAAWNKWKSGSGWENHRRKGWNIYMITDLSVPLRTRHQYNKWVSGACEQFKRGWEMVSTESRPD